MRKDLRQPWPEAIAKYIQYINEELDYLRSILVVCRKDGFSENNHILVTRLAPIIVARMRLIDMAILEAVNHEIEHAGRHPTWQKKLDFIFASSDNLGVCIQNIEYNIKHKRWTVANKLLGAAFREIDEILEAIDEIPFRGETDDQGIVAPDWPIRIEQDANDDTYDTPRSNQ